MKWSRRSKSVKCKVCLSFELKIENATISSEILHVSISTCDEEEQSRPSPLF